MTKAGLLLLFALFGLIVAKCNPPCASGECCSQWGYCGTGTDYCGTPTPLPKPTQDDSRCHPACPSDQCCSQWGYCGVGPAYCGNQPKPTKTKTSPSTLTTSASSSISTSSASSTISTSSSFTISTTSSNVSTKPTPTTSSGEKYVYVGTYQNQPGGIVVYSQDQSSGALKKKSVTPAASPSSLATFAPRSLLFDISEFGNTVGTFSINKDGSLQRLSSLNSGGSGPAFVSVHSSGNFAFVANYGSGHFASYTIDSNGRLQLANIVKPGSGSQSGADNQWSPHAHMIVEAPNGWIAGVDLGSDAVYFWKLSSNGQLTSVSTFKTPSNTGPRHITFHEGLGLAYVLSENANTILSFHYNETNPKVMQIVSSLPDNYNGPTSYGAEIRLHPNKRFLYATNRGYDTVAVFSIDNNGRLTQKSQVKSQVNWPRGMNVSPQGGYLYVAGQKDDTLATFEMNDEGELTYQNTQQVTQPVDITFL